jgi:hypothetical protein
MAIGAREQREGNALKTALVVTGGLVLVWVTVETAFGSFLSRLRGAIARSDPHTDPDDDVAATDPAMSASQEVRDEPETVVADAADVIASAPLEEKDEPEPENPSLSTGN